MTTFTTEDREHAYGKTINVEPIPFAVGVNTSPPHIVDSGASVMKDEPVAYINVEERKLEWAKPMTWHTPTIAQMDKIPLYAHLAKTLTDEEIIEIGNAVTNLIDSNEGWIEFARAILKKASEK